MRYFFAFLLRNHFFFLFLLLEVIAFLMVAENQYYQHTSIINASSEITGTLQKGITDITQYLHLAETNKALAEENARLRASLLSSYHIPDTNTGHVVDTAKKQEYTYSVARVISNSVSNRNNYIMLDKGSLQGIKPDMAVISPDGVVGIVSKVSPNFSWVISLLHKQTKISSKILKNGFVGTVVWDGFGYATGKLQDIPANVQISKGDTVVTSGYSHAFPPNMVIGTIHDYKIDKGFTFYEINLRFAQDFNKLAYVYVVTDFMKNEKLMLEKFKVDE